MLIFCLLFLISDSTPFALPSSESKIYCSATLDDEFSDDKILVVINKSYSQKSAEFILKKFNNINAENVQLLTQSPDPLEYPSDKSQSIASSDFKHIIEIKLKSKSKVNVLNTIKKLEKLDFIESTEPNYSIPIDDISNEQSSHLSKTAYSQYGSQSATPNDPILYSQYSLTTIGIQNAWQLSTGSASVKVGIIDTGISSHPDLVANLKSGWDFYNNNSITTDDPTGHGTHIAGIIGATTNNLTGICGINWSVSLIPLQTSFYSQESRSYMLDTSAIIKAIDYAQKNNISIINCSFIYTGNSNVYETQLKNYSGLVVCAAGNDSYDTDLYPQYPACSNLNHILSVANTDANDHLVESSNYGSSSVDIAAPGEFIISTVPTSVNSSGYAFFSGTSMAAPHVAGVAALIKSIRPELSAAQIKSYILAGADKIPALNGKCATGGRLNAANSINLAMNPRPYVVSGDFNGDGYTDIARMVSLNRSMSAIDVNLSYGNTFAYDQRWWKSVDGHYVSNVAERLVAGDFNADGRDDIAAMYNYGDWKMAIHVYLSTGSSFNYLGNSWHYNTAYNADFVSSRIVSGDFNGDGKDDIATMYRYDNNTMAIHPFLSTGNGFSYQGNNWLYQSAYDAANVSERMVSGDFNGDGIDDVATMYNYGNWNMAIHVFLSNGKIFNYSGNSWHYNTAYNADFVSSRIVAGDFNGDGKDDIATMYRYDNNTMAIHPFLSTGSNFSYQANNWLYQTAYDAGLVENRFVAGDFNNDNKCDAAAMYFYWDGNIGIHPFISNGFNFSYKGNSWYD